MSKWHSESDKKKPKNGALRLLGQFLGWGRSRGTPEKMGLRANKFGVELQTVLPTGRANPIFFLNRCRGCTSLIHTQS
jgi:hypothetical protein